MSEKRGKLRNKGRRKRRGNSNRRPSSNKKRCKRTRDTGILRECC